MTRADRRSTSGGRAISGLGSARTSRASGSGPPSRQRSAPSRRSSGSGAGASSRRRSTSCGFCASSGRPRTRAAHDPIATSTFGVAAPAGSAAPSRRRTGRSRGGRSPGGRHRRSTASRETIRVTCFPGLRLRLRRLAGDLRFEDAARLRDRIAALEQVVERIDELRRLRAAASVPRRARARAGDGAGDLRRRSRRRSPHGSARGRGRLEVEAGLIEVRRASARRTRGDGCGRAAPDRDLPAAALARAPRHRRSIATRSSPRRTG